MASIGLSPIMYRREAFFLFLAVTPARFIPGMRLAKLEPGCLCPHSASRLKITTLWVVRVAATPHPLGVLLTAFTPIQAGAGEDCLQASAAGGFGLPTPAEWRHSVSC